MGKWLGIGGGTIAVAVLAWQTWAIMNLQDEVSELRGQVANASTGDSQSRNSSDGAATHAASDGSAARSRSPGPALPKKSPGATGAHTNSSRGGASSEPTTDPAFLDDAVERSLERVERARFEKKSEHWMQKASTHISNVLDQYVDDGRVRADAREQINDLLLNALYQTWQLKADVVNETMSEEDAMTRYRESTKEVVEILTDLVGEQTATDLLADVSGKGK